MKLLFLVTFLVSELNGVLGVACNFFVHLGFAENYCITRKDLNWQASFKFECNGDEGTWTSWNSIDCSGDYNETTVLNASRDLFTCSSTDDSCGVIKLEATRYYDSLNCSGEATDDYSIIYYMVSHVDCFAYTRSWVNGSYEQTCSVEDGLDWYDYNDHFCETLDYHENITNGECGSNDGNSTLVIFTEIESGTATSTTSMAIAVNRTSTTGSTDGSAGSSSDTGDAINVLSTFNSVSILLMVQGLYVVNN